ncbi:hypothetical protein [Blastococcus sp. SYSU D00695]
MTEPAKRQHAVPPADMTTAEKLAAEWEARHDVVARGHAADPLALQHYLAHARADESAHRSPPPAPATPAAAARPVHDEPAPPPAPGPPSAPARTPWWRRLFGRS